MEGGKRGVHRAIVHPQPDDTRAGTLRKPQMRVRPRPSRSNTSETLPPPPPPPPPLPPPRHLLPLPVDQQGEESVGDELESLGRLSTIYETDYLEPVYSIPRQGCSTSQCNCPASDTSFTGTHSSECGLEKARNFTGNIPQGKTESQGRNSRIIGNGTDENIHDRPDNEYKPIKNKTKLKPIKEAKPLLGVSTPNYVNMPDEISELFEYDVPSTRESNSAINIALNNFTNRDDQENELLLNFEMDQNVSETVPTSQHNSMLLESSENLYSSIKHDSTRSQVKDSTEGINRLADTTSSNNRDFEEVPEVPEKAKYAAINRRLRRDYVVSDFATSDLDQYAEPRAMYTRAGDEVERRVEESSLSIALQAGARDSGSKTRGAMCRILSSFLAATVLSTALLAMLLYWFNCWLLVAVTISVAALFFLTALLYLSRRVRCILALSPLCLAASRTGRVSIVLLLLALQLHGPAINLSINLDELSKALTCAPLQASDQALRIARPVDYLTLQIDKVITDVERAIRITEGSLRPLDGNLEKILDALYNGDQQLGGEKRICESSLDKAFSSCQTGVRDALDQCIEVVQAVEELYEFANSTLDKLTHIGKHLPNRRPTRADSEIPQIFRNTQRFSQNSPSGISNRNLESGVDREPDQMSIRNLCPRLNVSNLCENLEGISGECTPKSWAGEAISSTVNTTRRAIESLRLALRFHIIISRDDSNERMPVENETSKLENSMERYRIEYESFHAKSANFQLAASICGKLMLVLWLGLLLYVVHCYIISYLSSDKFDNYDTSGSRFKRLEMQNANRCGYHLLPLTKFERRCQQNLKVAHRKSARCCWCLDGLDLLVMGILLSGTHFLSDYCLYWLLKIVASKAKPVVDITGNDSLKEVVFGDGIIVHLIEAFLHGFHQNSWSSDASLCLPRPKEPSFIILMASATILLILLLCILSQSCASRLRNRIVGMFYPNREFIRLICLYNRILWGRVRMSTRLRIAARVRYRQGELLGEMTACSRAVRRGSGTCRLRLGRARCLACWTPQSFSVKHVQCTAGNGCDALYCNECYESLKQTCAICQAEQRDVTTTTTHNTSHYSA